MTGRDVLTALDMLAAARVTAIIDGGWGVDALLGRHTREHADVDLIIQVDDLSRAETALEPGGFRRVPSTPELPARWVLNALDGRIVDFHLVRYDSDGNGWQELPGEEAGTRGWGLYPQKELRAAGTIEGRRVVCITAWLQLQHHLGFAWKPNDQHDMRLLHVECGIPLPPGEVT